MQKWSFPRTPNFYRIIPPIRCSDPYGRNPLKMSSKNTGFAKKTSSKVKLSSNSGLQKRVGGSILRVRGLSWQRFGGQFWEFGAWFGKVLEADFGNSELDLAKVRGSILGVRGLIWQRFGGRFRELKAWSAKGAGVDFGSWGLDLAKVSSPTRAHPEPEKATETRRRGPLSPMDSYTVWLQFY